MYIYDNEMKEYNFKILLNAAVNEVYLLSPIRRVGDEFYLEELFNEEVWSILSTGQKRALGYLFNNEVRTSEFLGSLIDLVDPYTKKQRYKFIKTFT